MISLVGNCQYSFFFLKLDAVFMSNDVPFILVLPLFVTTSVCPRFLERYHYVLVRTNHACVIVMILLHKMWKEFPSRIFFRESSIWGQWTYFLSKSMKNSVLIILLIQWNQCCTLCSLVCLVPKKIRKYMLNFWIDIPLPGTSGVSVIIHGSFGPF